jgi:deazaflavin-dependent oxidoreductase (nitroreductase family)
MDDFPEDVRREIAAHHEQYLRDPKGAHLWDPVVIGVPGGPVPCLLLHHTGRKSGQPLYTILQYYQHAGEIAIVASKGGVTHHPMWYLNLVANPRCEVQIGEMRWHASARTVAGAERAAWWARITIEQPIQVEYQKRTAREIPILLLDRVA